MGLKTSLLNTAFLTFSHNQYAIAFFFGILLAILILLKKPSRYATLLLIGFATLLLGFEYDKHIIEPLQNQTLESLSLDASEASTSLFLVRTFQKLLPIGFFIIGWGSLFLAMLSKTFNFDLKSRKSS